MTYCSLNNGDRKSFIVLSLGITANGPNVYVSFSPLDGVLCHHLLPVYVRLLDRFPHPGVQLLLLCLPSPDGCLQPPVQWHVSKHSVLEHVTPRVCEFSF